MAEDPEAGPPSDVLPTESNEQCGTSYWNLGGWVSFAKEKSKQTYDLMKKDFAELSTVVRTDAVGALARTVDNVKQKVTKSNIEGARDAIRTNVTKLIDDVSKKVAVVPPDDSETSACIITEDGELKTLNQHELRIYKLSQDAATFLVTPDSDAEFDTWNAAFDVEARNQELLVLLAEFVSLRKFYGELVPERVSHAEFWRNALFRIDQAKKGAQQPQPQPIAASNVTSSISPKLKDEHVEVADEAVPVHSIIAVTHQDCEQAQENTTVLIVQGHGTAAVSQSSPASESAAETSDPVPTISRLEVMPAEIKPTGDVVDGITERENRNDRQKASRPANDGTEPDSNDEWEKWDA